MRRSSRYSLLLVLLLLFVSACSGPSRATPTLPFTAVIATAVPNTLPSPATSAAPTLMAIITPTGTILITATPGSGAESATNWSPAGSLTSARAAHTASLLPGSRVLVVGGEANTPGTQNALARAELYDLSANKWIDAGSMNIGRRNQTATVLPNGQVVVIGGELARAGTGTSATTPTAEMYDATANSWRTLAPAASSRSQHTATLLPDGRVLVVGGIAVASDGAPAAPVATAEIYDPQTNTWVSAGSLSLARSGHTATMLPDGKVLIVGGESLASAGTAAPTASAELYDPATNSWSATGSLATGRQGHTATLLPDGRVLVVGGQTDLSRGGNLTFVSAGQAAMVPSSSAEIFDPQAKTWKPVASLSSERSGHTTTLLPGGQVLVVGGVGKASDAPLATSERYDPAADRWVSAPAPTARTQHTATLLPDGSVLIVGGKGAGGGVLATTERYVSRSAPPITATATTPPSATVAPTVAPTNTPTPTAVPVAPILPSTTPTPARTPTATGTAILAPPTATTVRATVPPGTTDRQRHRTAHQHPAARDEHAGAADPDADHRADRDAHAGPADRCPDAHPDARAAAGDHLRQRQLLRRLMRRSGRRDCFRRWCLDHDQRQRRLHPGRCRSRVGHRHRHLYPARCGWHEQIADGYCTRRWARATQLHATVARDRHHIARASICRALVHEGAAVSFHLSACQRQARGGTMPLSPV